MAKKSGSSNVGLYRFGGALALLSVFINGVVFIINWILSLVDGGIDSGVLGTVASVAMLIAIVIISWASLVSAKLPGNKTVWYIIYWALVILAFAGQFNLF